MATFDAKFGPPPVVLSAPDARLALLQFASLTLITYLSSVCFVVPDGAQSPSVVLSALSALVVTAVTYVIAVRSNHEP